MGLFSHFFAAPLRRPDIFQERVDLGAQHVGFVNKKAGANAGPLQLPCKIDQ